jgi:hypothetical protein
LTFSSFDLPTFLIKLFHLQIFYRITGFTSSLFPAGDFYGFFNPENAGFSRRAIFWFHHIVYKTFSLNRFLRQEITNRRLFDTGWASTVFIPRLLPCFTGMALNPGLLR